MSRSMNVTRTSSVCIFPGICYSMVKLSQYSTQTPVALLLMTPLTHQSQDEARRSKVDCNILPYDRMLHPQVCVIQACPGCVPVMNMYSQGRSEAEEQIEVRILLWLCCP